MARQFAGDRLVLATHNKGKLEEFRSLFRPHGVEILSAAALDLPEPEETGASFAENARLKAEAAMRATGLPALADDSGLAVAGLEGAPGVYSARWAGPERDFGLAIRHVLAALLEHYGTWIDVDPTAAFVCVLCLAWPDGHVELAEGRVEGRLVREPRGAFGFGYDPIFVPAGESRTFAEMPRATKDRLSHRSRAVDALLARCFGVVPSAPALARDHD